MLIYLQMFHGSQEMRKKYVVSLSHSERETLERLVKTGNAPARKLTRAWILLKSNVNEDGPNWSYEQIGHAYDVSEVTVYLVRKSYAENGLEKTINRKKPDRDYEHRLDGEAEAHLIALACGEPPNGQKRWTLRLLRDRMIKLEYIEDVSHETIRTTLKKTNLSLG
jgi:transposase